MPVEISAHELAVLIENGGAVRLLDVRQPWESKIARLANSLLIPLNELPMRAGEVPTEQATLLVVYCHHGVRSLSAVEYLRRLGHADACSLAGGIDAWSCAVDPTLPRY